MKKKNKTISYKFIKDNTFIHIYLLFIIIEKYLNKCVIRYVYMYVYLLFICK